MVDDFNQSTRNFTHADGTVVRYLNDPITGYTAAQISSLLHYMRGKGTPGMLPQYDIIFVLKANYPSGVTAEQIDMYFAPYYHTYWIRQWINGIF